MAIKNKIYLGHTEYGKVMNLSYKSKNDYGTAIRNYDLAAKNYQTAIDNATMMEMDDSVISIYQNAKSKSLSKKSDLQKKEKQASVKPKKVKVKTAVGKTKNKKAAFTMATIKLKNAHSVVGVIDTSHEYNA